MLHCIIMYVYVRYNCENTLNNVNGLYIPYIFVITRDVPIYGHITDNSVNNNTILFSTNNNGDATCKWIRLTLYNLQEKLYVEIEQDIKHELVEIKFYDNTDDIKPKYINKNKYRNLYIVNLYKNLLVKKYLNTRELLCIFRCFYESNKMNNIYCKFISDNMLNYHKYKKIRMLTREECSIDLINNKQIKHKFCNNFMIQ